MIICIGAGPGDHSYLTLRGAELIRNADVVAGFNAVVDVVKDLIPASAQVVLMGYRDQVAKLDEVAALHHAGKRCVVVFMGDIHFSGFQYLERVERACGHRVETLPGISSAQILASKALHRGGGVGQGRCLPELFEGIAAAANAPGGPGLGEDVEPAGDRHQQQQIGHRVRNGIALGPVVGKSNVLFHGRCFRERRRAHAAGSQ